MELAAPTWERFEAAVDGILESNSPWVALYFFDSALLSVDGEPCVATLGEPTAFGREKLCRLGELVLECEVNWLYIGVPGEAARWRDLGTVNEAAALPLADAAAADDEAAAAATAPSSEEL